MLTDYNEPSHRLLKFIIFPLEIRTGIKMLEACKVHDTYDKTK